MAPILPPPLRTWAARRAARRGLTAAALRACRSDVEVLTALGMYFSAIAVHASGRDAKVAQAASAAAMGDSAAARLLCADSLCGPHRRILAQLVALNDPDLALEILPRKDRAERAACAMALERFDLAESLLPPLDTSQSIRYQRGAIAAALGRWAECRQLLNAAFEADGLAAPLDPEVDRPLALSDFSGRGPSSMDGPLVSIVMPTHNAAATLAVAARSILSQSRGNIELLIVDDGSTDETVGIAHSIAADDSRVTLLRNLRSPGAYGARNTAVQAARGELLALHDADDWAHPERLDRQLKAMSGDRSLVLARHFRIDGEGRPVCPRVFPFIRLSPITAMFRTDALRVLGPFEEVRVGADSELIARFDDRFGRRASARLEGVMLVASWRGASLSRNPETGLKGEGWQGRVRYVEDWRRRHAGAPGFASMEQNV